MCSCGAGIAECMTRPGLADLYCTGADCCDAAVLTFGDIADDVKEWFDAGSPTAPDPPQPATPATAEEIALMTKYAAAVEIAFGQVARSVCMARYAAECTLTASFCVETPCSCTCRNCDTCFAESVNLAEIAAEMHHSRILSATVDGDAVSVNGATPGAPWELNTVNGLWGLFGATATSGGTSEIAVVAKPSLVEFDEAVKSLACNLVPGVHTADCAGTAVTPIEMRQFGLLGDPIADGLAIDCCRSPVQFGYRAAVTSLRWEATP